MKKLWFFIYNGLFIPVFYAAVQLLSVFNSKIKKGLRDRRRLYEDLVLGLISLDKKKKLLWFHSSSMGEFEQAKPIIQKLKEQKNISILATFFSPSGYENSKNYPYADIISYLPFDSYSQSKRFVTIVQPDLAIFMRYDIWPNFIWALKENKIPSMIVDATMRANSGRKLPIVKNFHNTLYKNISKILTVSNADAQSFKTFNISANQIRAVGDTRFDRVYQKSQKAKERKLFKENLFEGKKILVAGSTWDADEDVIIPAFYKVTKYNQDAVMFLVPHEPTIPHLEKLEHIFTGKLSTIRFSDLNNYNNEKVIIIDSIGILLTLYYYADFAYVGGSFKQGIHNVLEPAVYGIPVIFGPKIENSQEAQKLVSLGAAGVVKNKKEAYRIFRHLFSNEELRNKMGRISHSYVYSNIGATDKILKEIYKFL